MTAGGTDLERQIETLRRESIGRTVVEHDVATAAPMRGMVVTFDRDETPPEPGEAIPLGWHWAYFLPMARRASLGADGLPTETGVLPRVPLPRRMYAGCRLTVHRPLRVGDALRRETELTDMSTRRGGSGVLVFTTITQRIFGPEGLALVDERDSVFREEVPRGGTSGVPKHEPPPANLPWRRTIAVDPVSLFRYSALTFNPHRIHYDRPYAMEVEGYPGLVVHGPFVQQCLIDLARDANPGRTLATFAMRARAPLFDIAPFSLVGGPTGERECALWAVTPGGTIAMSATATLG